MGAASCDLPTIVVSGGPMLTGTFRGKKPGSGMDLYRLREEVLGGCLSSADFLASETAMSRSAASCNAMGTASTKACTVEGLGLALPGNAAIPAMDSRRRTLSQLSGRRIVEMVREGLTLSKLLTRTAFENAIRVNGAVGGSTNAVIHLLAIAGRIGVDLTLDDWDHLGSDVPALVNLMPSGKCLMEDFFVAGGLPPMLRQLCEAGLIDGSAQTVTGRSLYDNAAHEVAFGQDVIHSLDQALTQQSGIAVLRGNFAPQGAVVKPSAASPHLMPHSGRALVFDGIEDWLANTLAGIPDHKINRIDELRPWNAR